jgi:pimeloyl-ACP methyl ester carboxylesterase
MKSLFFICCFAPLSLLAQYATDWGAFTGGIDAKPYAGKKFRLQAAVKVRLIDSTADAEVWCRVDRTDKKMGFFYNMMDKPIRSKEWVTVSIEGVIDKAAANLAFGELYHRRGIFLFDNFILSVETAKGRYERVPLSNGGFESDSIAPFWMFLQRRNGFVLSVNTNDAYEGRQSCQADGSAFVKAYTYGSNDSTGRYASVNGIKLYYETYGEGEPLLLLHGNSESINSFRQQIPELAKKYRVIAVDTRGQGKSSEDGKTYTYDLFAEDMNALLDTLQLDSVHVLGWSDGGNTGLMMAMRYPRKVKKLVTMGANVFIDKSVVAKWVFKELDKQLKELANDSTIWGRNRVRLITLLLTEPRHHFEELKNIHCPVLVMAGEKDVIKEPHTQAIAAAIASSTLLIARKETHYYPTENAKAFNAAVLDFFGRQQN